MDTVSTQSRVSYSFGMKLSLPTKYESADFHISFTTDLQTGETVQQGFERAQAEVMKFASRSYESVRESETGLPKLAAAQIVAQPVETAPAQIEMDIPPDFNLLRKQIKSIFGVLEAQKKITKKQFVDDFLHGKKLDTLDNKEVHAVFLQLKQNFTELGL